jgi:hypothetical protein
MTSIYNCELTSKLKVDSLPSIIKMVQVPQALIQKSTKRFTTNFWLYAVRVQQLLTSQKPPRPMDGKQADTYLNVTKDFQNKGENL